MRTSRFGWNAVFAPDDGAGSGGAATGAGGTPPASLAEAAGIDPNKAPAGDNQNPPPNNSSEGQAPNGSAPPDGAGAADGQQQQQAAQLYAPEGLPEELRGASDKETIDKLLAKVTAPRAPETEAAYEFKLSETTQALVGDVKDDPVVAVYRGIAKKHDLSQDQANGLFDDFFGQLVDKGLIPKKVDFNEELKALQPQGESDPQTAKAAATKRVQAGLDFVNGLKTRKVFDDAEANMLFGLANSAKGVVMLEKLAGLARQTPINNAGQTPAPKEKTQAEVLFGGTA